MTDFIFFMLFHFPFIYYVCRLAIIRHIRLLTTDRQPEKFLAQAFTFKFMCLFGFVCYFSNSLKLALAVFKLSAI